MEYSKTQLCNYTCLTRNPYLLQLPDDKFIDSLQFGGLGRFSYHSCCPNSYFGFKRLSNGKYMAYIWSLTCIPANLQICTYYGCIQKKLRGNNYMPITLSYEMFCS